MMTGEEPEAEANRNIPDPTSNRGLYFMVTGVIVIILVLSVIGARYAYLKRHNTLPSEVARHVSLRDDLLGSG